MSHGPRAGTLGLDPCERESLLDQAWQPTSSRVQLPRIVFSGTTFVALVLALVLLSGSFNGRWGYWQQGMLRQPESTSVLAGDPVVAAGAHAARHAQKYGKSAAGQAAAAGAAAAKAARSLDFSKAAVRAAVYAAAQAAGIAAGMPSEAAAAAGTMAQKELDPSAGALVTTAVMPPPAACRTVTPQGDPKCWGEMMWIKEHGIYEQKDLYAGISASAGPNELQIAAMQSGWKTHCAVKPCGDDAVECLPANQGCVSDAVAAVRSWLAIQEEAETCQVPKMAVEGRCVCPPHMVGDPVEVCALAREPQKMTFYMYRAQSDAAYQMENVNMADAAGVMWYLHREVVHSAPRKFNITRVLRYLVTMKNTKSVFQKRTSVYNNAEVGKQLGPFGAYDNAHCTATGCRDDLSEFGYAVGCQNVDISDYAYKRSPASPLCDPPDHPACSSGTWFSLPGPCPLEPMARKTDSCKKEQPGGACDNPDGSSACTYKPFFAGQVSLDELEGIPNYETWWKNASGPTGNIEYDVSSDRGKGTKFWDNRRDADAAHRRVESLIRAFANKYSMLPPDLPSPACP